VGPKGARLGQLGDYELLERIGCGGMAEVYKARRLGEAGFERILAVKRILPHLSADEEFVSMFIDEAKIAVQLSHPNIAAVHDLGRIDGNCYLVLDYVHGRDLRQLWEREREWRAPPHAGIACHVIARALEGLSHAHRATDGHGRALDLIHRDVTPQNILVSFEGDVKIVDFGLAKAQGRAHATQAGVVKGKLAYLAPEQIRGLQLDPRVDVYAAGIVLWELLTGQRLFYADTDLDTLRKVHEGHAEPPSTINKVIPPQLDRVVLTALAKERDARYQNAQDFLDALEEVIWDWGVVYKAQQIGAYVSHFFPEAREASRIVSDEATGVLEEDDLEEIA
jgi:serine/threonine protein kinase